MQLTVVVSYLCTTVVFLPMYDAVPIGKSKGSVSCCFGGKDLRVPLGIVSPKLVVLCFFFIVKVGALLA